MYVPMKSPRIKTKGVMYPSEKLEVLNELDKGIETAVVKCHYDVKK